MSDSRWQNNSLHGLIDGVGGDSERSIPVFRWDLDSLLPNFLIWWKRNQDQATDDETSSSDATPRRSDATPTRRKRSDDSSNDTTPTSSHRSTMSDSVESLLENTQNDIDLNNPSTGEKGEDSIGKVCNGPIGEKHELPYKTSREIIAEIELDAAKQNGNEAIPIPVLPMGVSDIRKNLSDVPENTEDEGDSTVEKEGRRARHFLSPGGSSKEDGSRGSGDIPKPSTKRKSANLIRNWKASRGSGIDTNLNPTSGIDNDCGKNNQAIEMTSFSDLKEPLLSDNVNMANQELVPAKPKRRRRIHKSIDRDGIAHGRGDGSKGEGGRNEVGKNADKKKEDVVTESPFIDLWDVYGVSMHFATLEFVEDEVEAKFGLDHIRRNKRFVRYSSLFWPLMMMGASFLVGNTNITLGGLRPEQFEYEEPMYWDNHYDQHLSDSHGNGNDFPLVLQQFYNSPYQRTFSSPVLSTSSDFLTCDAILMICPVLLLQHWCLILFQDGFLKRFQGILFLMSLLSASVFAYWIMLYRPEALPQYSRAADRFENSRGEQVPLFTHSQVIVFLLLIPTIFRLRFAYLIWSYVYFFAVMYGLYLFGVGSYVQPDYYSQSHAGIRTSNGYYVSSGSGGFSFFNGPMIRICQCIYWGHDLGVGAGGHRLLGRQDQIVDSFCDQETTSLCVLNRKRYGSSLAITDAIPEFAKTLLVAVLVLSLAYSLELLQRKDFIQSTMVVNEIFRNTQLMENIFPKHIIQILKSQRKGGKKTAKKGEMVKGAADDIRRSRRKTGRGQAEDNSKIYYGRKSKEKMEKMTDGWTPTQTLVAHFYPDVSIFFADVVSFTTMSSKTTPVGLVQCLNYMFEIYDQLATVNGVEKIKTIGDCYMAVTGMPHANPNHAKALCRFGLQMLAKLKMGSIENKETNQKINMRLGIASGRAMAGIVGYQKYVYDVWGESVQEANRMESEGEPMKLHVSESTYDLIKDDFSCVERNPPIDLGKTFFVQTENPSARNKSYLNDQGTLRIWELQTALENAMSEFVDNGTPERANMLAELNAQIDYFVGTIKSHTNISRKENKRKSPDKRK